MMQRRAKPRGFTIIEALVALSIVVFGFLVILAVFSLAYRQSTLTRNRYAALIMADSVLEELQANPYGTRPTGWTAASSSEFKQEEEIVGVIEGHKTSTTFFKDLAASNGSAFDSSVSQDTDNITVTITWSEGTGANLNVPGKTQKSLTVKTTLRRQP